MIHVSRSRRVRLATLVAAATLAVTGTTLAGDAPEHDITADDYFTLAWPTALAASPSGQYVAYTELRWQPPAERRNSDLWVVDTSSATVRRLTFDSARDAGPSWSPDERYIYFTSNRRRGADEGPPHDGTTQVWRIRPDGSGLQAVTRVKDGIGSYRISADGARLYYTVSVENTADEWKDLRGKFSDLEYGHGVTEFTQLWELDVATWRARKLIDEHRVIRDFQVSPDLRYVAMVSDPDEELIVHEGQSRVDVYDAATGQVHDVTPEGWRADHPSPFGWINEVTWSSDSRSVAWSISFDGYPARVYVVDDVAAGSPLREVERPAGVSANGGSLKWRPPGNAMLCCLGEDHARARVYPLGLVRGARSGPPTYTGGDVVVSHFDFSRDGQRLFVIAATPQRMPDIYLIESWGDDSASFDDSARRLTDINPQVDDWKMPRMSIVQWQAPDGTTVEGLLELPPDHQVGEPLPMVVEIHGGPTAASLYYPRFWIYGRVLLAAQGYAVLSPNYRGSTGYGDRFMVELVGRENDIEVQDILAGVDAMVQRGIADPERLGVMGWSNGGYLTNCLITHTQRFKAASSGAGVLDQVIQWGTEDTPGHVINFMKALPWSDPEAYRAGSPLYQLDRVRTPTLIHVGAGDPRVPAAHARALYRGLKHYVDVPTELVVYPGAAHSLTTYTHRKAKMAWDLAWFERFLKPTAEKDDDKGDPSQ